MFEGIGAEHRVPLTIYTDAYVVRGTIVTRQRRLTDILNLAEDRFIVMIDVSLEEFGVQAVPLSAPNAQINLGAVLFAVAEATVEPLPELRTPKVSEQALITVPPFKISGRVHILPEREPREALNELVGRFLPVTDAAYWSEAIGVTRTVAPMVAVNHDRAQILMPYEG